MQSKMTPGPWEKTRTELGDSLVIKPGICQVYGGGKIPEANAQAIAAVPELIEALQELLKWADYVGGFESKQWSAAKKALAKAGV